MEQESKVPTPPYVPYKTLRNFLDRLKQGVPGRIDRGLMGQMSGAAQSQVTTSLKYLGLITDAGLPTERMHRLVPLEGEDRRREWRSIIEESYPFIFGGAFDFGLATGSQLREEFEDKTTATGETIGRCIAFLKDAAADAGITVSPYINQKKGRAPRKKHNGQNTPRTSAEEKIKPPEGSAQHFHSHSRQVPAQSSLVLWGLFQKLPQPGSVWPKAERDQWMKGFEYMLGIEYKDSEQ